MRGIAPASLTVALVLIAIVAITHDSGHYVLTASGPVAFIGIGTTGDPRPTESSSTEENPSRKSLGEPACLARALWWIEQGADVIPLAPDLVADPKTGKLDPQPTVKWARSGDHTLKTEDEVRRHYSAHPRDQLGIRLGEGHGGRRLLCVDVDVKHYVGGVPPDGHSEPRPFVGGYAETTKNDGQHHVCAIKVPLPPGTRAREQGLGGCVDVLVDGLLVVAPSRFANAARPYEVLADGAIPDFDSVRQALEASADWLYPEWKVRHQRQAPRSHDGAAPRMTPAKDLDELRARLRGNDAGRLAERILKDTSGETRSRNLCLALLGHLLAAGATPDQANELLNCSNWSAAKIARLKPTVPAGVEALRAHAEGLAASEALLAENDARLNPWVGKPGWDVEPEIPILTETKTIRVEDKSGEEKERQIDVAVEPAYSLYNSLVRERGYRSFRLSTGEPRTAIPTQSGLVTLDPTEEGAVDWIGYNEFTRRGQPVPLKRLKLVATTLGQRALARDLPVERVVSLAIRLAAREGIGSYIDLADPLCRTVIVGPEGWRIAQIGMPIFDRPRHLKPLPDPVLAGQGDVELLFHHVLLAPGESPKGLTPKGPALVGQRLLLVADLIQQVVRPSSAKSVSVFEGADGAGKTWSTRAHGDVLDPSFSPTLAPPKRGHEAELEEAARNRFTVRIDNVSHVSAELSDLLCRLQSGIGLVNRKLYTDRDETVSAACVKISINGITPTPTATDLLRRAAFYDIVKPGALGLQRLGDAALASAWEARAPRILTGVLDLAVKVMVVLRDTPPDATTDSLAEYVAVGRALSLVLWDTAEPFDTAWKANSERQVGGALQDSRMAALVDYWASRRIGDPDVFSSEIATAISARCRADHPEGVSPEQAGRLMSRAIRLLEAKEIYVQKQIEHNQATYRRIEKAESRGGTTPPTPPLESFSGEKVPGGVEGGVGVEYETYSTPAAGAVAGNHPPNPTRQDPSTPPSVSDVKGGVGGVGGVVSEHPGNGPVSRESRHERTARTRSAFNEAAREEGIDP